MFTKFNNYSCCFSKINANLMQVEGGMIDALKNATECLDTIRMCCMMAHENAELIEQHTGKLIESLPEFPTVCVFNIKKQGNIFTMSNRQTETTK